MTTESTEPHPNAAAIAAINALVQHARSAWHGRELLALLEALAASGRTVHEAVAALDAVAAAAAVAAPAPAREPLPLKRRGEGLTDSEKRDIEQATPPLQYRTADMVRGLVRAAEFREQHDGGTLWDDACRIALQTARELGWGNHKVGALPAAGDLVAVLPPRADRVRGRVPCNSCGALGDSMGWWCQRCNKPSNAPDQRGEVDLTLSTAPPPADLMGDSGARDEESHSRFDVPADLRTPTQPPARTAEGAATISKSDISRTRDLIATIIDQVEAARVRVEGTVGGLHVAGLLRNALAAAHMLRRDNEDRSPA